MIHPADVSELKRIARHGPIVNMTMSMPLRRLFDAGLIVVEHDGLAVYVSEQGISLLADLEELADG